MDMQTLKARIEDGTIQTFGQFRQFIYLLFANAVMYNTTGHDVNVCAKQLLKYAIDKIDVG